MKKIVILAVLGLVNGMALANEPGKTDTGLDYNKIEVDYMSATINDATWNGYYTSGSFLVSESIFLLGNYASVSRSSTIIEKSNIGLGYRLPIAASTDFFTTLSYYSQTVEDDTSKSTDVGGSLGLGVRAKLSADTDVVASYNYISAEAKTYNNYSISLKYNVTESIFVTGGYLSQTGTSSASAYLVGAGVRF
jgi:hypothetical protein